MGIYTNNTRLFNEAYDYASEIPANTAYDAAFGCAHILADCQANDMALFESAIYSDFAEVKALQEGVGYVNENAFTNVIKKIVEMFKKLLAKIKGIFAAFIAKLTGAFTDGKKLVKKYEKQIIKYGNWKGFKCKCRQPVDDNVAGKIDTTFKYDETGTGMRTGIYKLTLNTVNVLDTAVETLFGTRDPERISEMENSDIKDAIVKMYIAGVTEYEDVAKQVEEIIWKDEKEIDGEDNNIEGSFFSKSWIKGVLNEDKWEKNVKKFNEKLEKNINVIIDNLEKTNDGLADWISKNQGEMISTTNPANDKKFADVDGSKIKKISGEKDWVKDTTNVNKIDPQKVQKGIHALQKIAGQEQEVITKVTSEYMAQVKLAMANARKVWTAAAAWSSGVHKESVEYSMAVGECAAEQFYTNMESL